MLLPPTRAHEIPGGNFGVLRSVVFEVGGFHPAMFAGEDFEFGGRLVLFGKRVAYSPDCRIRHFINHQKLSVVGLRARFKGWGATQRALMQLRGDPLSAKGQLRSLLRLSPVLLAWYRISISKQKRACPGVQARGRANFWFIV